MKIAINNCWGGFSVSKAVYDELGFEWCGHGYLYNEDFGIKCENYNAWRADPRLIAAIEKVGLDNANGTHAKVRIVDIPDGVNWYIDEYDGFESVHEKHRRW